ncbi:MAG TPA: tyrosine--tRNA ligase [Verrucomicrobiae bacterium]|jgi:tyrosyl-tRNA synthetase|nr:tyrosine--tRNA ligase [Verrucomicrobiae bacterium]
MTLSEELSWRGFVNQTTYKDSTTLDNGSITFYWGVDPSADSMTIGNLAAAMMVRHFIEHGHKAYLLIGGATGLIGDPDGKATERELRSQDEIDRNKAAITKQYGVIFAGQPFELVDNYDWFKGMGYLQFLRDIGKHVPMRQMLGRDFVQSRLGEDSAGISYAEFSYALIQGYDFLHLHREYGVNLQVCGADQWGNSIAGVDLIRRVTGDEAHVWSAPLIVNKETGAKFGKSEQGAVWLDPAKTTPTQFYQFWINCDDAGVADYLKVYTMLDKTTIDQLIEEHRKRPQERLAQTKLAEAVTTLVHGEQATTFAQTVTGYLVGQQSIGEATDDVVAEIRRNIPAARVAEAGSIVDALVSSGLASSNTDARRLLSGNAITVNGQRVQREHFEAGDFQQGRLLLRRGKAFKDTALIELG